MSLTKEECLFALDNIGCLCMSDEDGEVDCLLSESFVKDDYDILEQLIEEHYELVDLLKKQDLENLTIEELDKWFDRSLWHVNKVNELSKKTIELSRDIKSKQEIIDVLTTNPPLKFEEIRDGIWVWDNNWCEYFEVSEVYPKTNEFDVLIHQNKINKRRYETIRFEENRFYRREVNNDE